MRLFIFYCVFLNCFFSPPKKYILLKMTLKRLIIEKPFHHLIFILIRYLNAYASLRIFTQRKRNIWIVGMSLLKIFILFSKLSMFCYMRKTVINWVDDNCLNCLNAYFKTNRQTNQKIKKTIRYFFDNLHFFYSKINLTYC